MTLIVAITTRDTIWLVADRRVSRGKAIVKEDATKVLTLETSDGVAILGYAGLGQTDSRTEPSEWMSRVLRGRNWTLEQSLGAIADALHRELPRHLRFQVDAHWIIIPAFVEDEVRLYSIDLALTPDRKSYRVSRNRHTCNGTKIPPRFAVAGSGLVHLLNTKPWANEILRQTKAHDRGKVSALFVADRLARLNHKVHLKDKYVGPECIVTWRYMKSGFHKGGGGHQFYVNGERAANTDAIPTIGTGMDIRALTDATWPLMMAHMEAMAAGKTDTEISHDAINAIVSKLPTEPDENLR